MDGLLTAALFLSLTSMIRNRAQRSWTLDDGVTFGFQLFYVHAHAVNLVVVCSASLLNYFTCEKISFCSEKGFHLGHRQQRRSRTMCVFLKATLV